MSPKRYSEEQIIYIKNRNYGKCNRPSNRESRNITADHLFGRISYFSVTIAFTVLSMEAVS